jgi:hypothetical protein
MNMSRTKFVLLLIPVILLSGCYLQKTNSNRIATSIHAGYNKGGIVENTMSEHFEADAFTGATYKGYNAGLRLRYNAGRSIYAETGVDFMVNNQEFAFNDPAAGFMGSREIQTRQLMAPFLIVIHPGINLDFFNLRAGYNLQYNFLNVTDLGVLPDYSCKKMSQGVILGFEISPFNFRNGSRAGLLFECYRGSRIYSDHFNLPENEMPGSSFFRIALIYHMY